MDCLNNNGFMKFHPDTLEKVRKVYNLDKPGAMDESINILEEWLKKQNHFVKKDFDRSYLERTIIRTKGSVEKAKTKLDKLCTARSLMPIYFYNGSAKELTHLEILEDVILPKPTADNYRAYLLKNRGQEFDYEFYLNYYRRAVHMLEYQYAHDYVEGIAFILDFREANLMALLKKLDLTDVTNVINIGIECYGLRIKGIHMLSSSKFIEGLVAIFKQVLSAKLGKRIYVHKSPDTLKEHIDTSILPVEYGGTEKSLTELHQQFLDVLSSPENLAYIKMMNAASTDESYRRTDKFNENCLGMPGTFRTLQVD